MHVEETPFTKRRRFIVFTPDQFAQITEQQRNMILESMKEQLLPTRHPAYKQVNRVAMRLVKSNVDIPLIRDQKWSVTLIGSKEKNAFVLPSGHIFVFLGMLEMIGNDDQLGVVLGHEMAHAVLGHGMEQVSVMHFVDYILIALMSVLWAVLPSDIISGITTWVMNKVVDLLLNLPYGRLLENEADEVGLMLSAKACFDVRESVAFWERMQLVGEFEGDVAAQMPEFLSTHPSNSTRAQTLNASLPRAIKLRTECNCPPLPARNPSTDVASLKAKLEQAKVVDDPWKPYVVVIK
ncbi:metalloendopeptidase OMA1, mitochondrial-like isoform X2 [Paramacrobiotus metropolitanus]|nr:metalloendopeptidase OMA1, mitochondrial-like isoform X2 [Paramacrobiotus metropolitanus]